MRKHLPKRFKYENYTVIGCIALLFILFSGKANAQSLGDPIVNITFGSGTASHAGALPADSGYTSYTYSSADFPNDGSYTIEKTTNTPGTWWTTTDHTGNTNGYMMVVNASVSKTDYFYKRQINTLCGGTTYQFSAWVGNLLRSQDNSPPNITFSILNLDGTVIQSFNTGAIALNTSGFKWIQETFNFTLPASVSTVIIQMTNNSNGGAPANDLALDDITFRPYGSQISAVFTSNQTSAQTFCAGTSSTVSINATTTLASGYVQKLQMLVNGVWTDLTSGSTTSAFSFSTPSVAGTYYYRLASAANANIGSAQCVVASNQLTLTVEASPTPIIGVADTTCLGNTTLFTDNTVATGTTITSRTWNFGDSTPTSSSQSVAHTYDTAGDKTVTLTITNANGCVSAPATKTIHISTPPVAAFNYSTPDCVTRAVTFTNASTSTEGIITSWLWDYGDSTSETRSNNQPFQHTYTTAATYTVTLAVKNSKGSCPSSITHSFTVGPLPVVNFGVPGVCLHDTYAAFTDSTTIADGSALTYSWDFGDAANTKSVNTSSLKNPQHSYAGQGIYNVTLTVTSAAGCSVTRVKMLTVNGAVPVASFLPLNSALLCSDRTVYFKNQSTVDFGSITKIKLYFDFGGDTTISITDYYPYSGKLYSHLYPEFHTPGTKKYQVYMEAFSGGSCAADTLKPITLFATSAVTFTPQAAICHDGGTVQLTATKTTDSPALINSSFSGKGVTATGLFDPTVSGVGTFPIKYTYTSTNGCTDTLTQNITVNTSPTVNAGADIVVLEGGTAQLKATATPPDSVTYSWSPSTYLSRTDILNPTVAPKADITYTLTVTTTKGCSASSSVKVTILKNPIIPNTFTPNGDSTNDTWDIKYLSTYPDCTVDIFNRSGQKVFTSIGYPIPWNGRYNGVDLPVGVYYYIINPKLGQRIFSGSVTIIR